MAQNNPVNEQASYSTTGDTNAPLNTSSNYGTSTTSTAHPTTSSTGSKMKEAGSGIKAVLAGIHGAGEKLRGEFNSGVDCTFNEREGVAKNERIANAGDSEMTTGEFSHATKNREGVVPGDHERRLP